MTLEDMKTKLKKFEIELNKIEEKKRELQAKQKELTLQITVQEAEKATRVMEIIEAKFGSLTDDNMQAFEKMLEENSDSLK